MIYTPRLLETLLFHHLQRGKSILLLGPRQTGKSTLIEKANSDLAISLAVSGERRRYEKDPGLLKQDVLGLGKKCPLIIVDEVQKVPELMDAAQDLIDGKRAQFILTGSSARKLKQHGVNLLPGRVVSLRLDPFVGLELKHADLKSLLMYGSLPGIALEKNIDDRETDLASYVETYLEQEVRAEALVRRIGAFMRFLELAGSESGNITNMSALSQDIGVTHVTIAAYYEILVDCLIAERVEPLTKSRTRKKLSKSDRYLFFDLGVRRLCAGEGTEVPREHLGRLFEHYVGLELIRYSRLGKGRGKVRYWRDPSGAEVDFVIDAAGQYTPIEVKMTDAPALKHARHLLTFLDEYPEAKHGYVICTTPRRSLLSDRITALSWRDLHEVVPGFAKP